MPQRRLVRSYRETCGPARARTKLVHPPNPSISSEYLSTISTTTTGFGRTNSGGARAHTRALHTFISRYRSHDHPILGLPANTDGQVSFRTNLDETPVLTGETGGPLCVPPVGREGSTPSESSCTLGLNANGVTKMPPPLGQSATLLRTETGSSSVISTLARKHVRFARSRTAKGPHHTNTVQALVPSAVSSINVDVRRRG